MKNVKCKMVFDPIKEVFFPSKNESLTIEINLNPVVA